MKEFVKRLTIVLWMLAIAVFFFGLYLEQELDTALMASSFVAIPTWALQFILLGIVNPAKLFGKTE